uniref:F-box domain-containing protein n=1 Tax=Aegilops tauschii TaxID=37682 RepID=M8BTU0_AEGTA
MAQGWSVDSKFELGWPAASLGSEPCVGRRRLSEADGCCSGSILEIPNEMLQEILMKLPTKDVARPPTNEYKLFRFSFPPYSYSSEERVDVDVYTLGDARGWRKDSFLSPSRPPNRRNSISKPVMIDGKLHVVTKGWNAPMGEEAAGVLVVDVPAETCRVYPLPNDLVTYRYDNPLAFELKGRLCLAAHMLSGGRPKAIRFWVMSMENKESDSEKEPHWDLRYNFFVEVEHPFNTRRPWRRVPWSAWFQYETLCYTRSDTLHR